MTPAPLQLPNPDISRTSSRIRHSVVAFERGGGYPAVPCTLHGVRTASSAACQQYKLEYGHVFPTETHGVVFGFRKKKQEVLHMEMQPSNLAKSTTPSPQMNTRWYASHHFYDVPCSELRFARVPSPLGSIRQLMLGNLPTDH